MWMRVQTILQKRMNKIIEDQLKKVKVVKIPHYDDSTTEILIKKSDSGSAPNPDELVEGKYYTIVVANYIVNPFDGFTLHDNWNNGIKPTDIRMNIEVLQIIGKMVKVNAIGVTDKKPWSGWLPQKSILSFEEIL